MINFLLSILASIIGVMIVREIHTRLGVELNYIKPKFFTFQKLTSDELLLLDKLAEKFLNNEIAVAPNTISGIEKLQRQNFVYNSSDYSITLNWEKCVRYFNVNFHFNKKGEGIIKIFKFIENKSLYSARVFPITELEIMGSNGRMGNMHVIEKFLCDIGVAIKENGKCFIYADRFKSRVHWID